MLRSRSWRAISSAASRFVCRIVFSDVAAALVAAGVHVDGDERFGFVDHDVAAALQPHLAMKGVVDLFLDADRSRRSALGHRNNANAAAERAGNLADHLVHPIDRVLDRRRPPRRFRRSGNRARCARPGPAPRRRGRAPDSFCNCLLDLGAIARARKLKVAHEIAGALAFADGANDDARCPPGYPVRAESCAGARVPSDLRSCARCRSDR